MIAISFASPSHYGLQNRLSRQLTSFRIPYINYNSEWLRSTAFYLNNKTLLDAPRGVGYWAWKPYIMLNALQHHPGECILYLDASTILTMDPTVLMREQDFATVQTDFPNSSWTKRDCFTIMNCDTPEYWNARQVWAGIVSAKMSAKNILDEWLMWCLMPGVIDDAPSKAPNFPDFSDHRHDQSILTNLVQKYSLHTIRTDIFIDT